MNPKSGSVRISNPSLNLQLWQVCLRENNPLIPSSISTEEEENIPPFAPEWAGGKGLTPENEPPLTFVDCGIIESGARTGNLLPFEAAIRFGYAGKTIAEFLSEIDDVPHHPCPPWIPEWAKTNYSQGSNPGWTQSETKTLIYFWRLEILGTEDIARLLAKSHEETLQAAAWLGMKSKPTCSPHDWCGVGWEFQPDAPTDPKHLDSSTQHMVAEVSATRFSLLYERLGNIEESGTIYRSINMELDRILRLHTRIFEKYLSVKSRKYNQCSPSPILAQADLEQAGRTAIFDCLRRWHPERNIRFSRGAVCIAITREMIAWLESQRLVGLPDKIRMVARKLKASQNKGNAQEEYDKLVIEAGERCVLEAAKHQNSYAYITTVPIMDAYSEEESEIGGIGAGTAETLGGFDACHQPETNVDLSEMILKAAEKLNASEKKAVLAYHGIKEDGSHCSPMTLEEIGKIEGVTKERIRQRISKGKDRMKKWFEMHQVRCLNDALCAA